MTSGDSAETSDQETSGQQLVEGETTPLAPGTYRFSVLADDGSQSLPQPLDEGR